MLIVPVEPVANQTLAVTLGGQAVQLNIYQKSTGLFMDVLVSNAIIISGVLCENFNRIVRDIYLGFVGDFIWIDNFAPPSALSVASPTDSSATIPSPPVGTDPNYTGLGTQYSLAYLEASDLAGAG